MQDGILIVDGVELNRQLFKEMLKDEYYIIEAENGEQAVELIEQYGRSISAILLNLTTPKVDGFAVLRELNKMDRHDKIPVIAVSGGEHSEIEIKCFEYGVLDFIHKPYHASIIKQRIKNTVDLFRYKNLLEEKVKQQTNQLMEKNNILQQQTEQLKKSNTEIINILGTIVESRDLESGEHINRVKDFSRILAKKVMELYPEYGLTPEKVEMISEASALHDIGKISIPDHVLLKPGQLTDEEFELMKSHSLRGCDILNNIKYIWNEEYGKLCYEICRYHHERYDGGGYPDGLVGDEIPISSQIVSLADAYDALVSDRVYKKAFSKEEAYNMILEGKSGVFSPKLLECLKQSRADFEKLVGRNK